MQKQKGFTIIELIVVIAIIAVLASIVMVNVTQYIAKSRDAAIAGNLGTLLTNSAVYFDTNPSNTGSQFIADNALGSGTTSPIKIAITGAYSTLYSVGDSTASSQKWAACAQLKVTSTSAICVDYTGAKKTQTTTTCDGTTGSGKSFSASYTCN